MTTDELIAFELEIAQLFEAGKIRSPVHLSKGNEEDLIKIFQNVKPADWVFSNHRSHYHALLKGIPKEWLKAEILANRSITINNAQYRFFSSAIVGGILPIAVGVAMATKRSGEDRKVWVFVGDMAAETGIFHECSKYSARFDLPITFVIEDNGFSVDTPTSKAWGNYKHFLLYPQKVRRYSYQRQFPHQGMGKYVIF